MDTYWIAVIIGQALACAGFCSFVAKEKERDALAWFFLGLCFSLIALVAISGLSAPKIEPPVDMSKFPRTRSIFKDQ